MSGQLNTLVNSLSPTLPTKTTAPSTQWMGGWGFPDHSWHCGQKIQALCPGSNEAQLLSCPCCCLVYVPNDQLAYVDSYIQCYGLVNIPTDQVRYAALQLQYYNARLVYSTYPEHWVQSANKKPKNRVTQTCSKNKPVCTVPIMYVRGLSDKFRWISARYNIRTVLKQNTLWEGFWEKWNPTK